MIKKKLARYIKALILDININFEHVFTSRDNSKNILYNL